VVRVNGPEEVPADLHGTVAVTAGASAPDELVQSVIARLAPRHGVEEVRFTDEDEYFPPPRALRELLGAVEAAVSLALGAPATTGAADRDIAASDVLATLGR
jgi:4-hydroxy-3-methylbut-2-enyl diphosphate reductase